MTEYDFGDRVVQINQNSLQSKCDTCPIHNRTMCAFAGEDAARELAMISRTRRISAGQTIVTEQDSLDFVGNVVSGVVKLSKTLEDGRQQIVGLLFPSDFMGHIFSDHSRFAYEAASDVEICVFDRKAFETLVQNNPEIQHELLLKVLTELDATREWMVLLGCQNARERIASFLLMLLRRSLQTGCPKEDLPPNPTIRFPINRKNIALFLGTTIETISRQIQSMSKAHILKIIDGNTFEITSPGRLAKMANHEEWLEDYPV